ncbi:MAG TPA: GH25 family lysozyme [Chitinophagales bacterium]
MTKIKRKSKGLTYFIWLFNLVALVIILFYFHRPIIKYSFRFYRWYVYRQPLPQSGKVLAVDYPAYKIHGFDISHFQPEIDWKNVRGLAKNGDTIPFKFVFIKATEGTWWEDELFFEHWEKARKNGIIRGAYLYFHANKNPEEQAENFIESVKLVAGDLPPVIDVEETKKMSKKEIVSAIKRCAKVLEDKYHVKPILYSSRYFIEDYLLDDFSDYQFWIAHYYKNEMDATDIPWMFWQHTDKASLLSGAKIDANVFRGTKYDLQALLLTYPEAEKPKPPVKTMLNKQMKIVKKRH